MFCSHCQATGHTPQQQIPLLPRGILERSLPCLLVTRASTLLWCVAPRYVCTSPSPSPIPPTPTPPPQSCPAIQVYSGLNIDAALSSAACSFCAQEVVVEGGGEGVEGGGEVVEGGRVKMSKIFHWYADDFGSSQTERLRWISRYLPEAQRGRLEAMLDSGAPIQVELREYDWRLNKL